MALVKGPKAKSAKGFAKNVKTMEKAGKSKKRAVGTAYGEAYLGIDDLEKNAQKNKMRRKMMKKGK